VPAHRYARFKRTKGEVRGEGRIMCLTTTSAVLQKCKQIHGDHIETLGPLAIFVESENWTDFPERQMPQILIAFRIPGNLQTE